MVALNVCGTSTFDKIRNVSTMQILRVRLLHPGVPPEDLSKLDEDFRAFMECRDPGQKEQQGG